MKNEKQILFQQNGIYFLKEALNLPDEVIFANRLVLSGVEAVSILFMQFICASRQPDPKVWSSSPTIVYDSIRDNQFCL